MKSLLVAVFWPCWLWGPQNKPHLQFLYGSYALQLATRDNLKRRRLIQSPWYQARWGDRFQLAGDQSQKQKFENDHNGHMMVTSPDSAATGEGGDLVLCDDPHNVKEARSEAERINAINWWDQTMSTRLNDPKRGVRGIIMQRVHEMDLSGHVLQKGEYRHLCLPAEFEPKHPFVSPDDWRTEEGELLWPERIDRKGMDKLKRDLGSMGAAGQLQQRPSPAEGNIFKRVWFRYYDTLPDKFDKVIQSWDMAFKASKDTDYVVGEVWGKIGVDFYLIDVVRKQMDFPTTCGAVLALTAKYPQATGKLIEEKANGAAVMAQLGKQVGGMIPVRPDVSKEARAAGVSPLYEAGNVYVPRYGAFTEEFIEEHINFPNAAHDDQVDAASQAVSYLSSGVPFKIIDLNNVADTEEEQPQTEEEQYLRLLQSDEAWSEF